ncbi:polyprotein [Arracacha mottle virus]|uniref:Genome polyprotein n=1 Tax=Arracacha mottle virus TaxID=405558 RepID=A1C2E6_9POTV|nr:polyprotein [Arracacha mottle virus]ABI97034.2 polyprotein [Arracacha mottle virus]
MKANINHKANEFLSSQAIKQSKFQSFSISDNPMASALEIFQGYFEMDTFCVGQITCGYLTPRVEPVTPETVVTEMTIDAAGQLVEKTPLIEINEEKVEKAFAGLEKQLAQQFERRSTSKIVKTAKGHYRYRHLSDRAHMKVCAKKEQLCNEERAFQMAPPVTPETVVTEMTIDAAGQLVVKYPWREAQATSKRMKERIVRKKIALDEAGFKKLLKDLRKIMQEKQMNLEVVAKRQVRCAFAQFGKHSRLKIHTKHEDGVKNKIDLRIDPRCIPIICDLAKGAGWGCAIQSNLLARGASGFVLKPDLIKVAHSRYKDNIFVVRGMSEGKLYDARVKITLHVVMSMTHFSSSDKYWKGYTRSWELIKADTNHHCEAHYSIENCGEVGALLTQIFIPSGKITCDMCARAVPDSIGHKYKDMVRHRLLDLDPIIAQNISHHKGFETAIAHIKGMVKVNKRNDAIFEQVFKQIGNLRKEPFIGLNKLNEFLYKGSSATEEDWEEARQTLLTITRHMKDFVDAAKHGDISQFRNKMPSKVANNEFITCTHQLDKNAGFIWGQREPHAKRFFNNYYKQLDPSKGYGAYEVRKNPNGIRKLAIKSLIVSMNLHEFRQKMRGEFHKQPPLSTRCVGRLEGSYIHNCSCITNDDGSAFETPMYVPTRDQLVVGTSTDPRHIDLPKPQDENLLMVEDGYCYINIFIAMLVNVREEMAKDFTKMVRDEIIPKLGKWPSLSDVATTCAQLRIIFPTVYNAVLPRILVDHDLQMCHVLDSYGSLTSGYHVLRVVTVNHLIAFANEDLESEIKFYRVGGDFKGENKYQHQEDSAISMLIKGVYRPHLLHDVLEMEPHLLLLSILSPTVVIALYNNKHFDEALKLWLRKDQSISQMLLVLKTLAKKLSVAESLQAQMQLIETCTPSIRSILYMGPHTEHSYVLALQMIERLANRKETNQVIRDLGYIDFANSAQSIIEKSYADQLEASWHALSLSEKCSATYRSLQHKEDTTQWLRRLRRKDLKVPLSSSVIAYCGRMRTSAKGLVENSYSRTRGYIRDTMRKSLVIMLRSTVRLFPFIEICTNVAVVLGVFIQVSIVGKKILTYYTKDKEELCNLKEDRMAQACKALHIALSKALGRDPTLQEYFDYLGLMSKELEEFARDQLQDMVEHQKSTLEVQKLEQIIAFVVLVFMMFDAERSDCIFKTLNKLKGVVATMDRQVEHQSLDDIVDTFELKNEVIHFDLEDEIKVPHVNNQKTFRQWWSNQIDNSRTLPHYRTEGAFMEFTRARAAAVASDIAHSDGLDFLIRGAVGSGKSTGLPSCLSKFGRVLLIEPTRPLAENVHRQLSSDPFFLKPTLRMHGVNVFGSSPISIMTSGFAFHYFAHNPMQLEDYNFVIFDECHVIDASAMAFRSLLHEHHSGVKLLKVSATPPGRETDFQTQHPVEIIIEESASHNAFVSALGSGSNLDVLRKGFNILVYVASYNEVDTLSNLLVNKGYMVTKVDGRTMKHGSVEVNTKGRKGKPHFIVATNIIENGVTLDIDTVVDFGTKVSPYLDVDNRCIVYNKHSISFGERIQRLGRVGRFKPGVAVRIGHTEKGLVEIPTMIATEAALLCFAYNLPVMTANVSQSLVDMCTIQQVRTMHHFEITPFFMVNFVANDGSMHPAIHDLLKKFKLRDSEIPLREKSIPYTASTMWMTAKEYERIGHRTGLHEDTRIAFGAKDIPSRLHEELWECVQQYKSSSMFSSLPRSCISKVAYTLKTDVYSISRTLGFIELLRENELEKQAQFRNLATDSFTSHFSMLGLLNAARSSRMVDHTRDNLDRLENIKNQPLEYHNLRDSVNQTDLITKFEALQFVHHQSTNDLSKAIGLKGVWNKKLLARDLIIAAGVVAGGSWIVYECFKQKVTRVMHQGKSSNKKRRIKELRFKNARNNQIERIMNDDDTTMAEYFGSAYTAKGKQGGRTKGMGKKNRTFISMYGFEPTEYSYIKFMDPLTGKVIEENTIYADMQAVADEFAAERTRLMEADELDFETHRNRQTINAFFMKDGNTRKALKVDMTPHDAFKVCKNKATIAGLPERQGEFRQTGEAKEVNLSDYPSIVDHESQTLLKGLRDFNPVSQVVCKLTNESDGHVTTLYGVGFGPYIIANQHLFTRNNGCLKVTSHHGTFVMPNTTQIQVSPCSQRDIVIIKMPKDFPVFPRKLKFREPVDGERVCMVGTNFQERYLSSTVSESSAVHPIRSSHFWKHWVSTKNGDCGLPFVAVSDGALVGIHSLGSTSERENYFVAFDNEFSEKMKLTPEQMQWERHWKYNANNVCWGGLVLKDNQPNGMFQPIKALQDLSKDILDFVGFQSKESRWMLEVLEDNLKAVAQLPSQLVTKHVVKGECALFRTYLNVVAEAREFFEPKMHAYGKSKLNREAYIKDLMKYAQPITVGVVNTDDFDEAVSRVILYMRQRGFKECTYVTDHTEIFRSLNMKAAVGAMYGGKKADYFSKYTEEDKERILYESCERLFLGKMGVWNGSLKAELRSKEKIEANKTRTFTAAPIDTLLAGKVCVDDFNNQFYSMNLNCCWTVGMTKFYGGWNTLLSQLPEGWVYCDADGSRFDSSLTPYLINAVLAIREAFMEEWDIGWHMLRNLYTEIIYTPISAADGTVLKKFRGNNSGQPSTVVDNSLMVVLAMHYSFIRNGIPFEDFEKVCRFFVNGDDLLIAVEPSHEHILDNMAAQFSELGLNYDFSSRTRSREDLWFMSHCGISVEGQYIPKLEEERIVSILQWDRATLPEHRLEAICAAMVEAWGYPELLYQIRKFYAWVLTQAPYSDLALEGKAPYIAETALRKLYTGTDASSEEIQVYLRAFSEIDDEIECGGFEVFHENQHSLVYHQGDNQTVDAGKSKVSSSLTPPTTLLSSGDQEEGKQLKKVKNDRDVDAGSSGAFSVPRLKGLSEKMRLPRIAGRNLLNLNHLLTYMPDPEELYNTRATHEQLNTWYEAIKREYDVGDDGLGIMLNGFMVWCIENGTSPNLNGEWTMMDGDEQVTYPLRPIVENAQPTLRQIMAHFSDAAEAYIVMRNAKEPYMPRYGLKRNLRDKSLARFMFDFYVITSKTPDRAREAHLQTKAAALRTTQNKMFGLDGSVGNSEESTERHTSEDVNSNLHSLMGVRNM